MTNDHTDDIIAIRTFLLRCSSWFARAALETLRKHPTSDIQSALAALAAPLTEALSEDGAGDDRHHVDDLLAALSGVAMLLLTVVLSNNPDDAERLYASDYVYGEFVRRFDNT